MQALLLSGGLDSTAIAFWKRPKISFFVNYGQIPVDGERSAAKAVAQAVGSEFIEIDVDCKKLGSGSLAGNEQLQISPSKEWWPFRNQLLLTLVAPTALRYGVRELLMGSVATDNFHKDGTDEFFEKISCLMEMQEGAIAVSAPAVKMRCEELLKMARVPSEVILLTHSCHVHNYACGNCEGCNKHFAVLRLLGIGF